MKKSTYKFDEREHATVLAALRFWQRLGCARDVPEQDIATNGGAEKPLHSHQIDDLCERLNYAEEETGEPPRVLIVLDGGLVQDVIADVPLRATVLDYDTEGADLEDLHPVPQDEGEDDLPAFIGEREVHVAADQITARLSKRSEPFKEKE